MKPKRTACPLDCPDTCDLEVRLGADGRVEDVDGLPGDPFTDSFICGKVRQIDRYLYSEERLGTPLIRKGPKGEGQFEEASWAEALDLIAERLTAIREEHGGEAILPCNYAGSNGMLTDGTTDARMFYRLGASRLHRSWCAMGTQTATLGLYGSWSGIALRDLRHSKLILVWGQNAAATGIHMMPILLDAIKAGAKLVVVDPRRTPVAERAHLHIPVFPGADLPLALGLIRELFATGRADGEFLAQHATGVDALEQKASIWTPERAAEAARIHPNQIRELAFALGTIRPGVVRCGWGIERNRMGGDAAAAVLAIPAVAGMFGTRGGGFCMSHSRAWDVSRPADTEEPDTRIINMSRLGEALLREQDPPIKSLFVYNANPWATAPAQTKVEAGLRRTDLFTVVLDQVMTDTARYADVVLPATHFLEHKDLKIGYGRRVMTRVKPVIPPFGDARPNYEVFTDLLKRLGLHQPGDAESPEDLEAEVLATSKNGKEWARQMDETGVAEPSEGLTPILFKDSFPATPDRKIHLHPEDLEAESLGALYLYDPPLQKNAQELRLISPAHPWRISSSLGNVCKDKVGVQMHPTDAHQRGLKEGQSVRIANDLGEVILPLEISEEVREGVVVISKGLWARNSLNGKTASALCPDHVARLGQGACYNDAWITISPL